MSLRTGLNSQPALTCTNKYKTWNWGLISMQLFCVKNPTCFTGRSYTDATEKCGHVQNQPLVSFYWNISLDGRSFYFNSTQSCKTQNLVKADLACLKHLHFIILHHIILWPTVLFTFKRCRSQETKPKCCVLNMYFSKSTIPFNIVQMFY